MKMLKMKTKIFVIFFISTILLIAQPSNCFAPYEDFEAHDIYQDIFGLNPDAVPTDPFDQPTFFSEDDYATQYDCRESYDAFPDDASLALPFESIQANSDAQEYLFDQNTFRLVDSAPLLLQELPDLQPHFDFTTQQPSTTVAPTSPLTLKRPQKRERKVATCLCGYPECSKAYVNEYTLDRHVDAVHKGIKRFACTFTGCTQSFTRSDQLVIHMASYHGRKKPYECPSCTNAFARRSDLIRHRADAHEGNRCYACTVEGCSESFARSERLDAHMALAHGKEKPHKCFCSAAFLRPSDLARHIAGVHEGAKRYPCPKCTLSFNCKSTKDAHLLRIHKEQTSATSNELTVDPDNYTDKSNL